MSFVIQGLGTAVPPQAVDQAQAADAARIIACRDADQTAFVSGLYRHTGIDRRHMVHSGAALRDLREGTARSGSPFLPGEAGDRGPGTRERMRHYVEHSLPLALQASRRALERSGFDAAATSHLVTVSCTGFSAPGVDIGLVNALGLGPQTQRVHVGFMGCHGAVNGLRVAQALGAADAGARVLLCAVELCSLHYFYGWDPKRLVANALFADGAAALAGCWDARPPPDAWLVAATGSYLFPGTAYGMTWDIGDHGFEMTLSTRVPGLIAEHLRPWLEGWLRRQGLDIATVGSWAIHPGGPRILSAVEEGLRLQPESLGDSRGVLAEFGNMSSPTVLFILERLRARQAPRPCVVLAFGPGLVVEGALLR
jgi:predicted naringenin-chalcone synthase